MVASKNSLFRDQSHSPNHANDLQTILCKCLVLILQCFFCFKLQTNLHVLFNCKAVIPRHFPFFQMVLQVTKNQRKRRNSLRLLRTVQSPEKKGSSLFLVVHPYYFYQGLAHMYTAEMAVLGVGLHCWLFWIARNDPHPTKWAA